MVAATRLLSVAATRVTEALDALMARQSWPPDYRHMLEYAIQPRDPASHVTGVSRWAALVLACAATVDEDKDVSEAAVQAAVAATLLMTALDLLDDVEDREIAPCDDPAVQANVATGLLLLSCHVIATPCLRALPAPGARVLTEAALRACGGQHCDLSRRADGTEMSPEEAIAITTAKSATLVAALCRLGALAGGARGPLAARYAAFGHHLGLALQLANDLAAVGNTPEKTDVVYRRPTLPLVYATQCAAGVHIDPVRPMSQDALTATWVVAQTHRLRAVRVLAAIERRHPACDLLEAFLP